MSYFHSLRSQNPVALGLIGLGSVAVFAAYIGKRRLDHSCREISFDQLPQSSTSRHFLETARINANAQSVPIAWALNQSGLLASWADAQSCASTPKMTRWIPSFVAFQAEVPIALLASYGDRQGDADKSADSLMRNFVNAFLKGHATGLDGWLLDKDVPPPSFLSGEHMFGDPNGLGTFFLGTWRSNDNDTSLSLSLPSNATTPVSEFPVAEPASLKPDGSPPQAGNLMYWKFPEGLMQKSQLAASYGSPWRLMDGGFQEFIVEKMGDTARLTYVTMECSELYPNGQESDFKRMPWAVYWAHVLYAQNLLWRTLRQLKRSTHV